MPAISNHRQQALERLLEQYKDRPKLKGLLSGLVNPLQEIEEQLTRLESERWLDEAEGIQLDQMGKIVGELRNNRGDEEYRLAIYTRIFLNRGGGTPEDIIAALNLVYDLERIEYSELYPASFQVYVQGYDGLKGIKTLVESIRPAGVGNSVITHSDCNNPFMLSECSKKPYDLIVSDDEGKSEFVAQDRDSHFTNLNICSDEIVSFEDGQGLGEIIIRENYLKLGNGERYMVSENIPLVLIADSQDYMLQGGGGLTEVIEHD